jgi:hypothetical protein
MFCVPPVGDLLPDHPPVAVQVPTSFAVHVSVTVAGAMVLEAVAVKLTEGKAKALAEPSNASRVKPARKIRMLYVTATSNRSRRGNKPLYDEVVLCRLASREKRRVPFGTLSCARDAMPEDRREKVRLR